MTTTAHWWGGDLTLSPQADVASTSGLTASQQAVVRRLCTPPGDYVFHTNYGAGLQQYIGHPVSIAKWSAIKALILAQMQQEPTVSPTPTPVIHFTADTAENLLYVTISYTDSEGNTQTLQLPQV